ncbi:MAG: ribosomal large subunit pseudouridine synthase D [Lysobacterales bacterium]|jgi:23S rRNA pseudouridine1911/1915/1917 synthase|nr:MAG: ribosomal large subunit pseudouridine synthase D [Xanthomonadales bacterium]
MDESSLASAEIPLEWAGERFDRALARLFPEYSRSRLAAWIKAGRALLDGERVKASARVLGGELIELDPESAPDQRLEPEPIPLSIVYQDEALIVVDKPAGLTVHPGAGQARGTLQNALLHHFPELARLPRAGIVHRLDKDTSGLLVVARSERAHRALVEALSTRQVGREYLAVVQGVPVAGGAIEAPIGRHPRDRLRMAVVEGGRQAITHFRVRERFAAHALLAVRLETGRTHQIRVHLAHLGFPLVGDPLYGGKPRFPEGASPALRETLAGFRRQALHAESLELVHPAEERSLRFRAEPPTDLKALIEALRRG